MSKREELMAKIDKAKTNKSIPDGLRATIIQGYVNQIKKLDAGSGDGGESKDPGKIKKFKFEVGGMIAQSLGKGSSETDLVMEFHQDIIQKAFDSGKSAKATAAKVVSAVNNPGKKPGPKKKEKTEIVKRKNTYTYKGKKLEDITDEDCAEAIAESQARRSQAKKSEKKSKSRPVMEKVTSNIARGVKQAIDNIPAEDFKDAPGKELAKVDRLIKATKAFIRELKSVLGEDFNLESMEGELKPLHALAKELHNKYGE